MSNENAVLDVLQKKTRKRGRTFIDLAEGSVVVCTICFARRWLRDMMIGRSRADQLSNPARASVMSSVARLSFVQLSSGRLQKSLLADASVGAHLSVSYCLRRR